MTKNKLYVVEVSFTAFAWAESSEEAEDFADEIVATEDSATVEATETDINSLGWDLDALVYHKGGVELRLRDVLYSPPPAPTQECNYDYPPLQHNNHAND